MTLFKPMPRIGRVSLIELAEALEICVTLLIGDASEQVEIFYIENSSHIEETLWVMVHQFSSVPCPGWASGGTEGRQQMREFSTRTFLLVHHILLFTLGLDLSCA